MFIRILARNFCYKCFCVDMVVLVYHVAIVCALVFMADVSAVVVSAIISINITASVLVVVSVFGVAFLLNFSTL